MADFLIATPNLTSYYNVIRSFNIDIGFDKTTQRNKLAKKYKAQRPYTSWMEADDWSLRLMGQGTENGCEHYLQLARPGSDYQTQLKLEMSNEINLGIPVQFLDKYPQVATVFYGTLLPEDLGAEVSTKDILKSCGWMAKLDGKIVDCDDVSKEYAKETYDVLDYFHLTKFGSNGLYLIAYNPNMIKFNSSVVGTCSKTGSKFMTLSDHVGFHMSQIRHIEFDSGCDVLPNEVSPTHVLVNKDQFSLNIRDMLFEEFGFETSPNLNIRSNLIYSITDNKVTFDMQGKKLGVINISLDLDDSSILEKIIPDARFSHTLTIVRNE